LVVLFLIVLPCSLHVRRVADGPPLVRSALAARVAKALVARTRTIVNPSVWFRHGRCVRRAARGRRTSLSQPAARVVRGQAPRMRKIVWRSARNRSLALWHPRHLLSWRHDPLLLGALAVRDTLQAMVGLAMVATDMPHLRRSVSQLHRGMAQELQAVACPAPAIRSLGPRAREGHTLQVRAPWHPVQVRCRLVAALSW